LETKSLISTPKLWIRLISDATTIFSLPSKPRLFIPIFADYLDLQHTDTPKRSIIVGISLEGDMLLPAEAGASYDAFKRKLPMQIETTKKLFTIDEYYGMAKAGILRPGERVELIDGEIFQMTPIENRHLGCVNRATRLFVAAFLGRAVVSVQHPVQLTNYTEPQPDVAVLKFRTDDYSGKKPEAEDTILILEVSDTTLRFDRKIKMPRYAAAGISEMWIANLEDNELLVYRDPEGDTFRTALTLHRGDSLSVVAFPDAVFSVDELLG